MGNTRIVDESIARRFLDKGGKWQMIQILILLIFTYSSTSYQAMVIVVIGFQPKYDCLKNVIGVNNNSGNFEDKCEVNNVTTNASATCSSGYMYDIQRHESIVSEWDLVCDKAYLAETSQLLYTIGMAVGSFIVSPLSDRFGRRWTLLILRTVYIFCGFGLAVVPNIIGFMSIRFITGTIDMALGLVLFVYIMELSPVRIRPLLTIATGIAWALNLCVLALIAHLLRGYSWRILQAVVSIPALTVILEFIFLRESLLWLYANNKLEDASVLLRNAMKVNNVTLTSLQEHNDLELEKIPGDLKSCAKENGRLVDQQSSTSRQEGASMQMETKNLDSKRITILDIIRNRTSRMLVLMVAFAWFVNSLVYYGIFFMSNDLAGDRILNFFLNSVVEIPANLMLFACMKYFGRRKPLVALHGLCALSLLTGGGFLTSNLSSDVKDVAMLVLSTVGKFGITATFSLVYLFTVEVFPTNFRASGLGLGSTSARLGSFMSPFSGVLARELKWGPGIIFGGLCFILTIILFWAPETANSKLPQSIRDIEDIKAQKGNIENDSKPT